MMAFSRFLWIVLAMPLAAAPVQMNAQDKEEHKFTVQDICWSPDGGNLFFSGMWHLPDYSDFRAENWSVYKFSLGSGEVYRIIDSAMYVSASPNGQHLATGRWMGRHRNLFVYDYEGRQVRRLTASRYDDFAASWSPDGNHLVFNAGLLCKVALCTVGSDGKGYRVLVSDSTYSFYNPQWGPGGLITCHVEKPGGSDQIALLEANGSGFRYLTNDTLLNYFPHWIDEHTVLYTRDMKNAGAHPVKVDIRTGMHEIIPGIESVFAVYSNDSSMLAFVSKEEGGIVILDRFGTLLATVCVERP